MKAVQAVLKVLEEQVRGLLRVVELFEARKPKGQAIISEVDGDVAEIESTGLKRVVIHAEVEHRRRHREDRRRDRRPRTSWTPARARSIVERGRGDHGQDRPSRSGTRASSRVQLRKSHLVPYRGYLEVQPGQHVSAGDRLTEGPLDPQKVLDLQGVRGVQEYLVREIQAVYKSQGVDINDKHVEIIVPADAQEAEDHGPGRHDFLPGQVVDKFEFEDENRRVRELDPPGTEATADWLLARDHRSVAADG